MEHLNRKLQQLLLEKIALDNSLMTSLPKSILQEAIQGKLVPQIVEEGTAKELLDQIKEEKEKLVKQGKLKKSALNDGVIFRGDAGGGAGDHGDYLTDSDGFAAAHRAGHRLCHQGDRGPFRQILHRSAALSGRGQRLCGGND